MLLVVTNEHNSAFFAAERAVGYNRDDLPDIHIEGIKEIIIDWDALKRQYRKKKPDPQKVECISTEDVCDSEEDEVLYKGENGIRVFKEMEKKSFVPLLLPPVEIVEEDGKKKGIVQQDAIAAVISAVPKGSVVTKSRVKDFLVIIYSMYLGNIPFDTETTWEGYARYCDEYKEYGYDLHPHRLVSDQGEIYGNGMSWRYRSRTCGRRHDAETLSHEGIPTFEENYRCYVYDLEEVEYDFDDIFVAVEKERRTDPDYEDEDLEDEGEANEDS